MPSEKTLKLVGLLGSFTWLFYWTGRWYKEWYFLQFGIPYEVLGFDRDYYLFGSWATVGTAASVLLLLAAPVLVGWHRSWWPISWLSVPLLGAVIALQVWHPEFHPEAPWWRRLLGSGELVTMAGGLALLALLAVGLLSTQFRALLRNTLGKALAGPWYAWLIVLLLSWGYLAGMGYVVGVYHGQTAIWQGRMGTRWVKYDDAWWVFAVRADAQRNFIFDRVRRQTKAVTDVQIEEWNGPVTRLPR
jgi:hypothetical protein